MRDGGSWSLGSRKPRPRPGAPVGSRLHLARFSCLRPGGAGPRLGRFLRGATRCLHPVAAQGRAGGRAPALTHRIPRAARVSSLCTPGLPPAARRQQRRLEGQGVGTGREACAPGQLTGPGRHAGPTPSTQVFANGAGGGGPRTRHLCPRRPVLSEGSMRLPEHLGRAAGRTSGSPGGCRRSTAQRGFLPRPGRRAPGGEFGSRRVGRWEGRSA